MRAVLVNYSHPDTPHVSAVRATSFANALAEIGHQVLLLTRTLDDADPGMTVAEACVRVREHQSPRPLHVGIRPIPGNPVIRTTKQQPRSLLSRTKTAYNLLRHGGVYPNWVTGARPFISVLARTFEPDVILATFIPTDSLVIAQQLGRASDCPWLIDFKDAWRWALPGVARRVLARRFGDAKHYTANSHYHADQATPWFPHRPEVIYDGISQEFLVTTHEGEPKQAYRIVLVGSVYRRQHLLQFLSGLRLWLSRLPEIARSSVEFAYAGGDVALVEACVRELDLHRLCQVAVKGFLPLPQLAQLCRGASVNAYLWLPTTFHHKILELLACGRPVLVVPGEYAEAKSLAAQLGGHLILCKDEKAIADALTGIGSTASVGGVDSKGDQRTQFSWTAQARQLERVLQRAIAMPRMGSNATLPVRHDGREIDN